MALGAEQRDRPANAPLDGYYVGGWEQGQDPDGKFFAKATFSRPVGGEIVVEPVKFTKSEGLQIGLLGSQPIHPSAAAKA